MVKTTTQHGSKDVQSLTVLASSDISLVRYWRSITCQGVLQETQGEYEVSLHEKDWFARTFYEVP